MRGLDPRIHLEKPIQFNKLDCRVRPGDDAEIGATPAAGMIPDRLTAPRRVAQIPNMDQRQSIDRLTPLADLEMRIDRLVAPVAPRRMPLGAACGRVLAADILAGATRPERALAWRDGVAVSAEATADAGPYAPAPLAHAEAVEVGDALPAGADAVALPDAIKFRGSHAEALAPVAPGEGVLAPGADAVAGEPLRRSGERLQLTDAAALAALGITHVDVREPRIAIALGSARRDDAIDAILNWLSGAVAKAGCVATVAETAFGAMDETFFFQRHDALFVVGGSGLGARDGSVRALARRGRVEAHGVALAPGESAAFGVVAEYPVLVVPGRFDAALAVWLTLGRRLATRLCGGGEERADNAILSRKLSSALGLVDIVPVRRHGDAAEPLASGHLPLSVLARADGFIRVPADSEGFPAGATVEVRPLP
jgi:molybdopterin biosynthesis enzyme